MKKVHFSNVKILGQTDNIEEIPAVVVEPLPLPKSKSINGLSSLSKSIIEHENKQNEMNDVLENMREVVKRYQDELFILQQNLKSQNEIIKSQETCLSEYEQELKQARDEIKNLVDEIKNIWDS
jgi:septal ring factor EnvC (AmiA/AmiB activator)